MVTYTHAYNAIGRRCNGKAYRSTLMLFGQFAVKFNRNCAEREMFVSARTRCAVWLLMRSCIDGAVSAFLLFCCRVFFGFFTVAKRALIQPLNRWQFAAGSAAVQKENWKDGLVRSLSVTDELSLTESR